MIRMLSTQNETLPVFSRTFEIDGKENMKTITFNVINVVVTRVDSQATPPPSSQYKRNYNIKVIGTTSSRIPATQFYANEERLLKDLMNNLVSIQVFKNNELQFTSKTHRAILAPAPVF